MRLLGKLILAILANVAGLLLAAHYIPGFFLSLDLQDLFVLAPSLMVLNFALKPILRLLLGPVIVITLGLGTIIVNVLILKLLDFLAPGLSIQGVIPLFEATVLLSVVNFVLQLIIRI